jgi:DNA-binding transcriptional MerR regulator
VNDAKPPAPERLTVGGAAALVGVSVRTLHHWDAIGLVRPSLRTAAGYRVYTDEDIARVHRILVYREIGMPLAEIGRLLDDPDTDAREHLRRQRGQLRQGIIRLERMADAVDRMLAALDQGIRLSAEEQVAIFGGDWDPSWAEEAERRWGDTPQWRQYAERAARLEPEDWKAVAARTHALNAELADAERAGLAPGSPEANALAERHRALMSTYFDCTHAMHVCIGRRYADDPRFTANIDAAEPGLAAWLRDVITANAAANGIDPATATWA